MQRKIKTKLLIIQLAAMVPLLIFIFYIFDLWYDARRTMILEDNITEAKLVALFTRDTFVHNMGLALNLASDPSFQKTLSTDKPAAVLDLKNMISNFPEVSYIYITDSDGNVVASTMDIPREKITTSDKNFFRGVTATKKPAVSDPFVSNFNNLKIVNVSAPIIKGTDVTGIVTIALSLDGMKSDIERTLVQNKIQSVIIIDTKGHAAFMPNQQPYQNLDSLSLSGLPFYDKTRQDGVGILENLTLRELSQQRLIGGSVAMVDPSWMVVSVEPVEEILSPLLKLQTVVWLIILTSFLFAFSLISYYLRKIRIIY